MGQVDLTRTAPPTTRSLTVMALMRRGCVHMMAAPVPRARVGTSHHVIIVRQNNDRFMTGSIVAVWSM
jgi:hypothetical protein